MVYLIQTRIIEKCVFFGIDTLKKYIYIPELENYYVSLFEILFSTLEYAWQINMCVYVYV